LKGQEKEDDGIQVELAEVMLNLMVLSWTAKVSRPQITSKQQRILKAWAINAILGMMFISV
jgi:hypothetical protein